MSPIGYITLSYGGHFTFITIGGFVYNLTAATLGNIVGGWLFMGLGYWYVSKARSARLSKIENSQVSIIFE